METIDPLDALAAEIEHDSLVERWIAEEKHRAWRLPMSMWGWAPPATETCYAFLEERWLGPESGYRFEHRGACTCGWRGEPHLYGAGLDAEGLSVTEAHDHAFAGWQSLPAVRVEYPSDVTSTKAKMAVYRAACFESILRSEHPEWIERVGCPVVTERHGWGTRHVEGRSPWGGYDMAREAPADCPCASCLDYRSFKIDQRRKRRKVKA